MKALTPSQPLDTPTVSDASTTLNWEEPGKAYADWLTDAGIEVKMTVEHAALDPFRGYANAIRDELPDAVAVLDAFHVVKLAGNVVDEVRRSVQQRTLHRRGHKDDPLYKIRRLTRAT